MKFQLHTLIVFALASILLVSCKSEAETSKAKAQQVLQADGYKTSYQEFSNKIVTTANLLANEQVELLAPISGQVLNIYFEEGQKIAKNKAIIRIDDRAWRAQLVSIKASLIAAEKDYQRKKDLLEIEGSSQEDIDNAFSNLESLKSQKEQLEINIDLANVSAPFSGQLGLRNFSKGAFLQQGTSITTLTELSKLKVDFTLPQIHQNSLAVGKTVVVLVGNDSLEAKIYAISPIINNETRTINIRAYLKQPKNKVLLPGTFVEVLVSTESIEKAILIPTQAIVPSLNEQTVYVSKNGKAIRKVVKMGNRTADNVHIVEGLNVGDTIITSGLLQVKEGMSINFKSIKQ